MREVVRGQFSGEYEDADDLYDDIDEVTEEDDDNDDDLGVTQSDIDRQNDDQGSIGGLKLPTN